MAEETQLNTGDIVTIAQRPPKQTRADEINARELVNLRDRGVCVSCGTVHPLFGVNFDHRKNRSQGGIWSASNGQLLCGSGTVGCHGYMTQHPAEAIREGWAVPSYANPAEWPARRMVHGHLIWVLYDDGGGWVEISEAEAKERMGS